MKTFLLLLLLLPTLTLTAELSLERESLQKIGLKVWQNECRGTLDGLISWNAEEEFPSLGIGHFIWYPANTQKTFEETFPAFITFLKKQDEELSIPSWITSKKGCPWKTRNEFVKMKRSKKMLQLRDLLSGTLDHQILFLYERFQLAENKLLPFLGKKERKTLANLKESPQGVYALIDYVNFKGTGLAKTERYRGQGWGLLQVLEQIPKETQGKELISAFIHSAKHLLHRRVRYAPSHRKEEQWLKGWNARLESYREPLKG
ncbi:MAG: hypothetical protein KR126chlam1_00212 [Chlamydiae bacterium]|nr:hypothetical protein [Chlamydiota bacterium]